MTQRDAMAARASAKTRQPNARSAAGKPVKAAPELPLPPVLIGEASPVESARDGAM